MNRLTKMIIIFIFTYFTIMLLCANFNLGITTFTKGNILLHINVILKDFDIIDVIMGVIIYFFYYSVFFNGEKFTKKNVIISIISVIFSTVIVIGKNLQVKNAFPNIFNIVMLFEVITIFIGAYLAFYAIFKKLISIEVFDNERKDELKKKKKIKNREKSKNTKFIKIKRLGKRILTFMKEHPFISSLIIILLCRIPYMIIYYPANTNGDTVDHLCQFFNRSGTWSKDMVNLVNPNVYLNSHHPIFSTLLIGGIVKFGKIVLNYNFGLFLYILFQVLLSTIIFAFLIYYMKKEKVPFWIRNLSLTIICLVPQFSSYVISAIKDTPNAAFTLLYVVFLIQIVRNYDSIFNRKGVLAVFIITMLLVLLFRNNGIITIALSYPFLFLLYKKNWKKLLIVLIIPVVIWISFNEIMYRCFDASKGSKKEMLSVPFMQIARVVNKKGKNAFSKNDQKIINKVLSYKKLGDNYYPDLSDSVKNLYKNKSTNKDLWNFFKVWFKNFFKYPDIYVDSFIHSTYQYFYPYETYENTNLYFDGRVTSAFPTIKPLSMFEGIKTNISYLFGILFKLPIIGLLFKVCFYDWLLLGSCFYVIYRKNFKYLIPLLALLSVLIVCLASPVNGCMRYILPILFSSPAIIMIDYLVYKEHRDI